MSKIELDDVKSGYNLGKINANFAKIKDLIDSKVLMRDNTDTPNEPNHMEQELDLNSNGIINVGNLDMGGGRISNLGPPLGAKDPIRVQDLTPQAGGGLKFVIKEEVQVLADGQIHVTLNDVTSLGAVFYISGADVDSGRLGEFDFKRLNPTNIELTESYPNGTLLTAVQSDTGAEQIYIYGTDSTEKTLELSDGQLDIYLQDIGTQNSVYYIAGEGVDSGRLPPSEYTVLSSDRLLLRESYPEGTQLTIVQTTTPNSLVGATGSFTSSNNQTITVVDGIITDIT